MANFDLEQGAWVQLVEDGSNASSPVRGNIPATVTNGNTTYVLPSFTATHDFEVNASNATFLRANGGNGGATYYGLVDIYGVQGMQGFLTSNFTLNGLDISASGTSTWNNNAGFVPIGSEDAPFQGQFSNGEIDNLTIHRPGQTGVGLFSVTGASAVISSITIEDSTITGNEFVGAVAGDNYGTIEYGGVYNNTVVGNQYVGGETGYNEEAPPSNISRATVPSPARPTRAASWEKTTGPLTRCRTRAAFPEPRSRKGISISAASWATTTSPEPSVRATLEAE